MRTGVEFVELDRFFDLGTARPTLQDSSLDHRLQQDLQVDRTRYHGLHGNAILSRYPIQSTRIVRLPVCYDWYGKERQAISKLESGKRWSAGTLFRERIEREVRRGGRMALIADLSIPDLPTPVVTVVSTHLENRCPPRCRQEQMKVLLNSLRDTRHPVILAGDLNTSGSDAAPTSVRNEIMKRVVDYRFWIRQSISWFTPIGIPQYASIPLRYFFAYLDPTAIHVHLIWHNPERRLFRQVEKFRFTDGYVFDFRGQSARSSNGTDHAPMTVDLPTQEPPR
ncbi:MAG: endonuclease/exonuclease/phosphatase family protein [Acidobacteriota bacterium]|nr:endonuclease/exonuclease/phosphatase family protein [Acidobacteriota bacterium]